MAFIQNGKTYTLQNTVTGKMLNLYGGNTTNGTNVCQYSADGSNEQKWTAIDNKLYTYCSSTKCLDRYNLPSSNNHKIQDIAFSFFWILFTEPFFERHIHSRTLPILQGI